MDEESLKKRDLSTWEKVKRNLTKKELNEISGKYINPDSKGLAVLRLPKKMREENNQ